MSQTHHRRTKIESSILQARRRNKSHTHVFFSFINDASIKTILCKQEKKAKLNFSLSNQGDIQGDVAPLDNEHLIVTFSDMDGTVMAVFRKRASADQVHFQWPPLPWLKLQDTLDRQCYLRS